MKKIKTLGRNLSKEEQRKVSGGVDGSGCTFTYSGCEGTPGGGVLCDYWMVCPNESKAVCGTNCMYPGDGSGCQV